MTGESISLTLVDKRSKFGLRHPRTLSACGDRQEKSYGTDRQKKSGDYPGTTLQSGIMVRRRRDPAGVN